jgi:nucleoside-diphosphate-sugar epimerase
LLCGHKSFAARGLDELLRRAGHEVVCFTRGPEGASGDEVTGGVLEIADHPALARPFDVVVNFIVLKNESVEQNEQFARAPLDRCRASEVKHLVHISSISVYAAAERLVREETPIETDPGRKGAYGGWKVGAEWQLLDHRPPQLRLSLVRPGFILAAGLLSPMPGVGLKLPDNRLLAIGNARSVLPVVTREQVHRAVATIVELPAGEGAEVFLLAAADSPRRDDYLELCCRVLGAGLGVVRVPVPLWMMAAVGGEMLVRALGQAQLRPYVKIAGACRYQRFDPQKTERRLGMRFSVDLGHELSRSIDGQSCNLELPYERLPEAPSLAARSVSVLGYGRIVQQRHLPALDRLGFAGRLHGYDVRSFRDDARGHFVRSLEEAAVEEADIHVVASPGPVHAQAIEPLRRAPGAVIVEKPLALGEADLKRWLEFAAERKTPTLVCHNYRFKDNVAKMMGFVRQYNPGRLLHVHVHFESPPVAQEPLPWIRDERRARTLLMDYGLHFLDLACMFGAGDWKVDHVHHELDGLGGTGLIRGALSADNYGVSLLLRQGYGRRSAQVVYTFQNYSVRLGFFPDTFDAWQANDNPWLWLAAGVRATRSVAIKIRDKLTGRDSDRSHAMVYVAAERGGSLADAVTVERLAPFYRAMFDLGDRVYGKARRAKARRRKTKRSKGHAA